MNFGFLRIRKIVALLIVASALLMSFFLEIAPMNDYLGYREFSLDATYLGVVFILIVVIGLLIPYYISRPTDFFALFYALFVLFPFSVLYPIRGEVGLFDWCLAVSVLTFPMIVVPFLAGIFRIPNTPALISEKSALRLIIALCILGLVLANFNTTASAGFSLEDVYIRRIEGRDVFETGTFLSYLNAMIVNSFAPFIAFYSGLRKKYALLIFALLCWLGYFYLLGLKAPLFYVLLGFLIGSMARINKIASFFSFIFYTFLLIFCMFFVEFYMFGYSFVGDYLIRRMFTVPPFLVSAYIEHFGVASNWSFFKGNLADVGITFVIGESLLGREGLNANTSAFMYHFGEGGILMYLLAIIIVSAVFSFMDSGYRNKGHAVYLFLGFIYAILIVEQSATTALLSSGVGPLLLVTTFLPVGAVLRNGTERAG